MGKAKTNTDTRGGIVSDEFASEEKIGLAEAARQSGPGRGGQRRNPSTLLRWIKGGVQTPAGVVRLQAERRGHLYLTSVAAFRRFTAALTEASTPGGGSGPRTPTERHSRNAQSGS